MVAGLAGTAEGVETRDSNPATEEGDGPVGKLEAVGTVVRSIAAAMEWPVEEPVVVAMTQCKPVAEEAEQDRSLEETAAALSSLSSIYQRSPW